MAKETKEAVNPITITNKNGDVYILDYDRASCAAVNKAGFNANEIESNPEEMLPLLFFGAFKKHHRKISKADTDKILEEFGGGIPAKMLDRLVSLYVQVREGLIVEDEEFEENAKNTGWTIEI